MPMKPVRPTLLPDGWLLCPNCKNRIQTPRALNPATGRVQKMILKANRVGRCPACSVPMVVDTITAERHNRFWYPKHAAFDPARN
jgi:hypothetical protein